MRRAKSYSVVESVYSFIQSTIPECFCHGRKRQPKKLTQPSKPPSLDNAFARLHRAEEHLADLIRKVVERGQKQVDAVEIKPNPDHPKQVIVKPNHFLPLDRSFGIIVGEACYNLRAALDYLIYELAILDSGFIHEGTQFPIVHNKKGFKWWINGGRLDGLNATHIAAIEAMQPYRGCKWAARLRDISNPDKHKTLTATQAEHALTVHVVDRDHLRDFEDIPGPIRRTKTSDGTEVYVKFVLATQIQFGDGSPVVEPIEEIKNEIARTLEAFKPEFK